MKALNTRMISSMFCVQCLKFTTGLRSFSQISHLANAGTSVKNTPINFEKSGVMHTDQVSKWYTSKVVSNHRNSLGIRTVEVEVPKSIFEQYKHPGQFLKVKRRDGSNPNFLSMCSPPNGTPIFSFLVKDAPFHNEILGLREGDSVELCSPIGNGFQLKELFSQSQQHLPCPSSTLFKLPSTAISTSSISDIILVACGSGIAPIAAAIESGQLGLLGDVSQLDSDNPVLPYRRAKLYIGARSPAHLPLAHRYAYWKELGVDVIPVFSRCTTVSTHTKRDHDCDIRKDSSTPTTPTSSVSSFGEEYAYRSGYVQHALGRDLLSNPQHTVALLCGMRDMTDKVRGVLLEAGVPDQRILLNF